MGDPPTERTFDEVKRVGSGGNVSVAPSRRCGGVADRCRCGGVEVGVVGVGPVVRPPASAIAFSTCEAEDQKKGENSLDRG